MRFGFGQSLDHTARRLVPFLTTLLFLLAGSVAWPLPHFGAIAPALGLIAIFFWTVHRPDLLSLPVVFLVGLLNDVINYLPLGLTAFVFVAARQIVLRQRRLFLGQSFVVFWAGFTVVQLIAMFSGWALLSVFNRQVVSLLPVAVQAVLTAGIFPLGAWALMWLQRFLPSQE